jgi:hypothetical protein
MNSEHAIHLGQIELVLDEDPATVPSNWLGASNYEDSTCRDGLLLRLSPRLLRLLNARIGNQSLRLRAAAAPARS